MNKIIIFKNHKSILVITIIISSIVLDLYISKKKKNIKVALCTMGKKENLYAKEFMEYYMNLGVNHIFIYDNNDPFTERIKDVLDKKYKERITFYQTQSFNIIDQTQAFTNCYENNF